VLCFEGLEIDPSYVDSLVEVAAAALTERTFNKGLTGIDREPKHLKEANHVVGYL
jgi:hypothetical protein